VNLGLPDFRRQNNTYDKMKEEKAQQGHGGGLEKAGDFFLL